MKSLRKVVACLAVSFAIFVTPVAALAAPDAIFEGDIGSVNIDVRMSVDGKIVSVTKQVVQQATSPNTQMDLYDYPDFGNIGLMANVADRVFLLCSGDILYQGMNKALGQIVSDEIGVILLNGDLVFDPGSGQFTSGVGEVLFFVYTAEMKLAVKVDDLGNVVSGTGKLKIYPGQAELVAVDASGGTVTVSSVQGTGTPAFLKIKLPAIKFWEVVIPL